MRTLSQPIWHGRTLLTQNSIYPNLSQCPIKRIWIRLSVCYNSLWNEWKISISVAESLNLNYTNSVFAAAKIIISQGTLDRTFPTPQRKLPLHPEVAKVSDRYNVIRTPRHGARRGRKDAKVQEVCRAGVGVGVGGFPMGYRSIMCPVARTRYKQTLVAAERSRYKAIRISRARFLKCCGE